MMIMIIIIIIAFQFSLYVHFAVHDPNIVSIRHAVYTGNSLALAQSMEI